MIFDWDDDKAEINLKQHKVSFREATFAFYDENLFEQIDESHSVDEIRYNIIGLSQRGLLFVAFTERDDVIRIISARKATNAEEEFYVEK